ncbi:MAG: hypothetical protein K5765_01160, partial [Clostridia bacterium]|nr:hypothetical protein [Clostridia bacterium]
TLRDVSRKIFESIKPQIYPTIEKISINGIDVIKVSFKGSDVPYSAFGKYYIRVFDEDRELTPSELRKIMISKEYEEHWEDKTSNETIDDVDEKTIERFIDEAKESGRIPSNNYSKDSILNMLGLLNNRNLTNAGKVLFSKNKPLTLKTIVFATKERETILDLNKSKGNIFELIEESMKFIIKNIRWKVLNQGEKLERKEVPEVPIDALREAILNSFAHARYDISVEHEIDIYSNRISIINPGSFANEFTPIDFYNRDLKSYLRNSVIANALYMRKDIETAGYGIKKIYRLCKKENVDINYINNEYDFTFEFSRIDRNDYLSGEINGEINGEISKNEEKVLDTLRNNNKLTKQGLIESTNLSSRTIDRVLANLKSKGLLERQGSNKTGYWKVK